ncbi:hypothetical protein NUSPORA_00022 [Nucleospora cyclopteri]
MRRIVIFGASGNLSCKKLFPKLFELGFLDIEIIAYARSPLQNTFKEKLKCFYDNYTEEFLNAIKYIQGNYDDLSELSKHVDKNTVLYFAIPPSAYLNLIQKVKEIPHSYIAMEKPYGTSVNNFIQIEREKVKNIFYVDHYLTKSLCSAFPKIKRDQKTLFNFLNNQTVKSVELYFNENIDAEGRAFFDKSGIVKDVMQTHLTQILAQILCEPDMELQASRAEFISKMDLNYEESIFGQYKGYEKEMEKITSTETFASIPFLVNSEKWETIPFLMSAGKALSIKKVDIKFKIRKCAFLSALKLVENEEDCGELKEQTDKIESMHLICSIAPKGEVSLNVKMNTKSIDLIIIPEKSIRNINCDEYRCFDDYNLIFITLFEADFSVYASSKNALEAWKLFQPIYDHKKPLFSYNKGIKMPKEAAELKSKWIN